MIARCRGLRCHGSELYSREVRETVRGTHRAYHAGQRGARGEPVRCLEQAHIARQAYTDFGKGRHPAGLNFGDCFAYALAKATAEPLLFKGQDFSKTDVTAALPFP
ncbi:MAG TPA: type II toxin-antitoxin system VapC family toxin [Methylomirabilota bacterium]